MTESLKGKSREEALKLLDKFHELLTTDTPVSKELGKLVVFCGVRDYPGARQMRDAGVAHPEIRA